MNLNYAVLATVIVSLLSLVGVMWSKPSIGLVAMAAGSLLAGAILHLIPEAWMELGIKTGVGVMTGVVIFFILEKVLRWRHCHEEVDCPKHHFGVMNLAGDAVHNLIDGVVIGGAFAVSVETGILTSIMVILHEIPQEIADFGVLLYAGWSKVKALSLNLLIGTTAIVGAIISQKIDQNLLPWLVAMTAGGFMYISLVDLVPEIKDKKANWGWFLAGVGFMMVGKLLG